MILNMLPNLMIPMQNFEWNQSYQVYLKLFLILSLKRLM